MRRTRRMLEGWHAEALLDFPGTAFEFHPESAVWGAVLLFRAACLTCFRDIGEAEIRELLEVQQMPDAFNPAAHFSADLCLRHWPDLYRMARARSEDDLLVKIMSDLAARFPFSSVGLNMPVAPNHPLFSHPGLHQLFAERALERADHACLGTPEISTLLRSKLGSYSATLGRGLLTSTQES